MLVEVVDELRKELYSIPAPSFKDSTKKQSSRTAISRQQSTVLTGTQQKSKPGDKGKALEGLILEDVDV